MITSWTINNFKSFCGRQELPFAPITVLCGANSSGKSTIIQSILLIKQTLQYAPINRPLALNGPLLKLGGFTDIKNFRAHDAGVSFAWTIRPSLDNRRYIRQPVDEMQCEVEFDTSAHRAGQAVPGGTIERTRAFLELQPSLSRCVFRSRTSESSTGSSNIIEHTSSVEIVRSAQSDLFPEANSADNRVGDAQRVAAYTVRSIDEETRAELVEGKFNATLANATLRHMLPHIINVKHDGARQTAQQIAEVICRSRRVTPRTRDIGEFEIPASIQSIVWDYIQESAVVSPELKARPEFNNITLSSFLQVVNSWLTSRSSKTPKVGFRSPPLLQIQLTGFSLMELQPKLEAELYKLIPRRENFEGVFAGPLIDGMQLTHNYFSNYIRYLGPLRDDPKPIYPLEAISADTEVGYRGEHTAAVLELNKDRRIRYIPARFADTGYTKSETHTVSLRDAVNDWLHYLGVADSVTTDDQGKLGHRLQVQYNGTALNHDLTNVGVGVSQVLPIIVMALLAPQGGVLILEQPELHLHPKVQTRLADFFLSMALLNKQCILETHSEYLIDRVRLRIAQGESEKLAKLFRLYFIERMNGDSKCQFIDVSRYGALLNYPKDFFDQSQKETEAILLAALHKRAAEKTVEK